MRAHANLIDSILQKASKFTKAWSKKAPQLKYCFEATILFFFGVNFEASKLIR